MSHISKKVLNSTSQSIVNMIDDPKISKKNSSILKK